MIGQLITYMNYPFVVNAMVIGLLIAVCSSLLGVTLVLRRFSFIGDGLSHVAFGVIAIASVLKMSNQMVLVLPITIISAILLLRTGQRSSIKGDAALAMMSVGSLAFGYLILNVFSSSSNLSGDVCSTLFGSTSILTLSHYEVIMCSAMSGIVILLFVLMYNKIFSVTFDEEFAKATGAETDLYNLIIAVVIAVVIVVAMSLVGALLISALVVFPALSAMRLFHSFRSVTVCSVVISALCAIAGIVISILGGTPVGSTIVAVDAAAFLICYIAGRLSVGGVRV